MAASPISLHDLRVLVVDDNATNRLILDEMLAAWRLRGTSVASGAAALDELARAVEAGDPYRVVIVDALMPEMDGFMLVERIRQNRRLAGLKLIMLTSAGAWADPGRAPAPPDRVHYQTRQAFGSAGCDHDRRRRRLSWRGPCQPTGAPSTYASLFGCCWPKTTR